MNSSIPALLTTLRESSGLDGGEVRLRALKAMEAIQPGLGWLSFWKVASEAAGPEAARTLAFALTTEKELHPAAEATRLWFLSSWAGQDLSTFVNILSGMERTMYGAETEFSTAGRSALARFLTERCLKHKEQLVKQSALDLVETASERGMLKTFLDRTQGRELANALEKTFSPLSKKDEEETLQPVCQSLRSLDLPSVLPANGKVLQQIAEQVELLAGSFSGQIGDTKAMIDLLRVRAATP